MLSRKDQYIEITAKVKLAPNGCWMRARHCRWVLTGCLPEDLGVKAAYQPRSHWLAQEQVE